MKISQESFISLASINSQKVSIQRCKFINIEINIGKLFIFNSVESENFSSIYIDESLFKNVKIMNENMMEIQGFQIADVTNCIFIKLFSKSKAIIIF